MTNLTLITLKETSLATASWLTYTVDAKTESPLCCVIEDGYNPVKIKGSTRIPTGRYQLVKKRNGRIYEKMKTRFGHSWVVEIQGIPDYAGVIFHPGNTHEDTAGCPLPCLSFDQKGEVLIGENSTAAYLLFMRFMKAAFEKGEVWLSVTRDLNEVLN